MILSSHTYKGGKIVIQPDDDPQNPRTDMDNLGTMFGTHKRYILGDGDLPKTDIEEDAESWEDIEQNIIRIYKPVVILPVYMYDHSGITINTVGYTDRWDSGQIGFIWVTAEHARETMGYKRINTDRKKTIEAVLRQEITTYDAYLSGSCVGFETYDADGEEIETVWGYYEEDAAIEDAKAEIDAYINLGAKP